MNLLCILALTTVITTATQVPIKVIQSGDLVPFAKTPISLSITINETSGTVLFDCISNIFHHIYPQLKLTITCNDFKYLGEKDLSKLAHKQLFIDDTVKIFAEGRLTTMNFMHVNLYVQPQDPIDEHVLPARLQETYPATDLKALKTKFDSLATWLEKVTDQVFDKASLYTYESYIEGIEDLEFAKFSQLLALGTNDQSPKAFLRQKSSKFQSQCNSLKSRASKLEAHCDYLKEGLDKAEDELIANESEIESEKLVINMLNSKLNQVTGLLKKENEHCKQQTAELLKRQNQIKSLLEIRDNYAKVYKKSQADLSASNQNIEKLTAELGKSQENLKAMIAEYEKVKGQLNGLGSKYEVSMKEIATLNEAITELKNVANSLKLTNERLVRVNKVLQEDHKESLANTEQSQKILEQVTLAKDKIGEDLKKSLESRKLTEKKLEKSMRRLRRKADEIEELKGITKVKSSNLDRFYKVLSFGASFNAINNNCKDEEELYGRLEQIHIHDRYEILSNLDDFSPLGLADKEVEAVSWLYLETFYAEGRRIDCWFKIAGLKELKHTFFYSYCFASEVEPGKVIETLKAMQDDIGRLEKLAGEEIEKIVQEAEDGEELEALKNAMGDASGSSIDPLLIKAVLKN